MAGQSKKKRRLVVGISGASGAPLAVELLKKLRQYFADRVEVHLVVTRGGEMTLKQECQLQKEDLYTLADVLYECEDIGAAVASGSFRTMGMIVIPCSMKTLAGIVSGYSDNLLLRAADVTLKERRKLVLVVRETPLGTVHLKNMYEASLLGAVIFPPMLNFYQGCTALEDCTKYLAERLLTQFDLETDGYEWEGM